jgi:hypothetical protein
MAVRSLALTESVRSSAGRSEGAVRGGRRSKRAPLPSGPCRSRRRQRAREGTANAPWLHSFGRTCHTADVSLRLFSRHMPKPVAPEGPVGRGGRASPAAHPAAIPLRPRAAPLALPAAQVTWYTRLLERWARARLACWRWGGRGWAGRAGVAAGRAGRPALPPGNAPSGQVRRPGRAQLAATARGPQRLWRWAGAAAAWVVGVPERRWAAPAAPRRLACKQGLAHGSAFRRLRG